ncbi:DUF72 domain-containing protein [Candidatus Parcubacteria bacterium]|nr:DUF72 domain-containing protein [Candidatus Parcubacteria bacterium]
MKRAYVGTSGFVYKSWHERFYPKSMKRGFLQFYADTFDSVEVNSTFYRLPSKETFAKWAKETPKEFVFGLKLSRYITHLKRLRGVKRELTAFFGRAKSMGRKFAVLLVQLPPSLKFDAKRDGKFFDDLMAARKKSGTAPFIALEPRHISWFEGATFETVKNLAKRHGIGLVFAHSSHFPFYPPEKEYFTAKFVYLRFHGPRELYASRYGKRALRPWVARVRRWVRTMPVFVYFNDDVNGYAVLDAAALRDMLQ